MYYGRKAYIVDRVTSKRNLYLMCDIFKNIVTLNFLRKYLSEVVFNLSCAYSYNGCYVK